MPDLGRSLIAEIRQRLVTGFPAQVRTCLDAFSDAEIWHRANDDEQLRGQPRPPRLRLHTPLPGQGRRGLRLPARPARGVQRSRGRSRAADLLRLLDETVSETARVLDSLDPKLAFSKRPTAGASPTTLAQLLLRVSHHWAVHTGQIVFDVKARKPGAFEELWMKTMEKR